MNVGDKMALFLRRSVSPRITSPGLVRGQQATSSGARSNSPRNPSFRDTEAMRHPGEFREGVGDRGRDRLRISCSLEGPEPDRVENGARLSHQVRIDRFVDMAHGGDSPPAVQVDHLVGFVFILSRVPVCAVVHHF